jgi:pimeloyl-ACP methyl ester carboxylesterase
VIYIFGECRIDTGRFEITRGGRALAVEPQVLELLIALIEGRDHVVTRDELLARVWKGRIVSDTTLSSRIKTARQVIGDDGTRQDCVRTIRGRGFRFVGEVEEQASAQPAALERPAVHYARSGEVHVAYQLYGEGPVNLVLAPGFVSHIDNYWEHPAFARWLARLGGLARVAMFDKRGTGLSDPASSLPDMDERMDDLRAVMDAARFETAFVMGISEGGSLAALFAAHYPMRCNGLILYGAFAQFKHWFPDEASLQQLFDYVERDWGSGKSLPHYAPSMAGDPELTRWWGQFERLGATPGACVSLMKMNSRIDIFDVLPGIRVPTLVIHRTGDVLVDVEAGRDLAARIPGARYVELPGADHLPFVGNADRIIDVMADFLEDPKQREEATRVVATILLIQPGAKPSSRMIDVQEPGVEEVLQRYRVTRVAPRGAGIAATFDGPARALECAVHVSRLLRRHGLEYRIGVHTGEIRLDAGDLEGTAMDISADVVEHANSSEILASRTVHDLVAGSGIALEDRGEFALPSIGQSWHLFRVVG